MNKMLSRFASLLAVLVTGSAGGTMITACGRTTSVVAPSAESPVVDAGHGHAAVDEAQDVFAGDTKKVVFTVKGGFVAPAPKDRAAKPSMSATRCCCRPESSLGGPAQLAPRPLSRTRVGRRC